MRSRKFAALITFFVTFGFSAAFASMFASGAADIETFLLQDISNGQIRDERLSNLLSESTSRSYDAKPTEIVAEYVHRSSGLDDGDMPQDFRAAWREHMRAWQNYSTFLQAAKFKNFDSEIFYLRDEKLRSDINFTWYKVLFVARKYGAEVPDEAR